MMSPISFEVAELQDRKHLLDTLEMNYNNKPCQDHPSMFDRLSLLFAEWLIKTGETMKAHIQRQQFGEKPLEGCFPQISGIGGH